MRDRAWMGERQRGRETQSSKQTPGSELSAQSLTRPKPTNCEVMSWGQMFKGLSHPVIPVFSNFNVMMNSLGDFFKNADSGLGWGWDQRSCISNPSKWCYPLPCVLTILLICPSHFTWFSLENTCQVLSTVFETASIQWTILVMVVTISFWGVEGRNDGREGED